MTTSKLKGRTLNYYLIKDNIVNNDLRYMPEDIKIKIIEQTQNCLGTIREKLYWLRHNLTDYPICKNCGNHLSSKQFLINISGNKYRDYCSKSCARTTKEFKEKIKKTSLLKYGVEHSFFRPEVQDKRKATNLIRFGREHPYPHGCIEFNNAILEKYGSIDNYVTQHNIKSSNGLIKHYLESGKIISIIQSIENKFNVSCVDFDDALNISRLDDNTLLSEVNIKWYHNFCKSIFISPINNGSISVCPVCRRSGTSLLEQTILSEILILAEKNNLTVLHKDRTVLNPKEIDILIPDINLGVEVNGLYWHSAENTNKFDLITKSLTAAEKGINLIHISEEQWVNKKELILSKLKYYFKTINKKIHGRKCIIKEVEPTLKNQFLFEHHSQGVDNSKIKLGLYKDAELFAIMTFGKSRFNKKYTWELIRYCVKSETIVNGAFNKLLKYFIRNFCNSGDTIVSFRDLSWGINDNNVYTKNKFILSHRSAPSYSYVSINSPIYISRYKTQKHKLPKLLGDKYNIHLSEAENMKMVGYHKFYDCGNDVYVYTC